MSKRNMTSILLDKDVIARLRKVPGIGQSIIKYAIKRYRRGDFLIQIDENQENKQNVLSVYPVENKPDNLTGEQINAILKSHFANPDKKIQEQIKSLDKQINSMFEAYKSTPYIIKEVE